MRFTLNINTPVLVKPAARGLEIIEKGARNLNIARFDPSPEQEAEALAAYHAIYAVDRDGYMRMPLWRAMYVFGPRMDSIGGPLTIETNIIVDIESEKKLPPPRESGATPERFAQYKLTQAAYESLRDQPGQLPSWEDMPALHRAAVTCVGEDLYAAGAASRDEVVALLRAALRDAGNALHRDRSGLAAALGKIVDEVRSRAWISQDRGPYAWDDERYKAEAGQALREVDSIATAALVASGVLVSPIIRSLDRLLPGAADDTAGLFEAGKRSRDEEVVALRVERNAARDLLRAVYDTAHGGHDGADDAIARWDAEETQVPS